MIIIDPKTLFLSRLPVFTRKAFLYCIQLPFFRKSPWYLAGGTALALQAGHRQSVDLDFFTTHAEINSVAEERKLIATGQWETNLIDEGTIYGTILKAKMSLIAYPFFLPSNEFMSCGTISILQASDIAAMKIIAVSQRGRKRDFVDLYWYCRNRERLKEVFFRAIKQYPGQYNNVPHLLKSLSYFADAENDPMPKLFFKASWKEIKRFFQMEAKNLAIELLGLK